MTGSIRVSSGRRSGQRFDAQHGIVTEALLFLGELDPHAIGPALEDATHYEPTPLAQFDSLLGALPQTPRRSTFIDVGAGMGRVVLLATLHDFRQVIGVEVSPALCAIAKTNLQQWRERRADLRCTDVRVRCGDGCAMRVPRGDLVVYLYNPFGEATLRRLVQRLAQETSGELHVLYHTPVHRGVFDADDRFEVVADLGFGLIYRLRIS